MEIKKIGRGRIRMNDDRGNENPVNQSAEIF